MSDLLIARIARRAANPDTQTDMGEMARGQLAPVLRTVDAEASEQALAFSTPAFLKLVYGKVGNGGFGPGYGLMGLMSGATDDHGHNAVDAYRVYSSSDPTDPSWKWPEGLLPICHWGCAIYSCVDCKTEGFPIVFFDPNMHDESWNQCFIPAKRNLDSWLEAWAAGVRLWGEVYGSGQRT